jgi:hypothetical protein
MIRAKRRELGPLSSSRVAARAGSNILSACRRHQLGNPVARQVERLEPLDAENPGRGRGREPPESPEPALQRDDQLFSLIDQVQCRPYIADVAPDPTEVARGKWQDSRSRMDRFCQPVHLAIRYRTDVAEPLSDDEIGPEFPDLSAVDGNYRAPSLPEAADLRIDRTARGSWVNRRGRDAGKPLDWGGEIALVGDPHEVTGASKCGHDLGPGRQQRDDAHSPLGEAAGPVVHQK